MDSEDPTAGMECDTAFLPYRCGGSDEDEDE
jgi:hypothetical protein